MTQIAFGEAPGPRMSDEEWQRESERMEAEKRRHTTQRKPEELAERLDISQPDSEKVRRNPSLRLDRRGSRPYFVR